MKQKKYAVALAAALIVLSACQPKSETETPEPASGVSSESVLSEAESSQKTMSASTSETKEASSQPASSTEAFVKEQGQLNTLFQTLSETPTGVAGASLKAAKEAVSWLNTLGDAHLSADKVGAALKDFWAQADEETKERFVMAWEEVKSMASAIAAGDEAMLGIVQDAGASLLDNALDATAWQQVQEAVDAVLPQEK